MEDNFTIGLDQNSMVVCSGDWAVAVQVTKNMPLSLFKKRLTQAVSHLKKDAPTKAKSQTQI